MFSIDDKNIKQLEWDLGALKAKAIPFATKFVINGAARDARTEYQKEIRKDLILRNKFTENSVRFKTTNTLNINNQVSVVGSVAPYMDEQEFGGVKVSKGKHGVPLATSYSSGEGESTQPRKKLPRRANLRRNIHLRPGARKPKTPKQAFIFKVQDAVTSGNRVFYHKFKNGSKGIYRVLGGSKKFKRGWPGKARIKMVWGLSNRSVRIPKEPMLKPAHAAAASRIPEEYKKALLFQLKKHRLFKG